MNHRIVLPHFPHTHPSEFWLNADSRLEITAVFQTPELTSCLLSRHAWGDILSELLLGDKWQLILMPEEAQATGNTMTIKKSANFLALVQGKEQLASLNQSTFLINPLTTCQDISCWEELGVLFWDLGYKLNSEHQQRPSVLKENFKKKDLFICIPTWMSRMFVFCVHFCIPSN